MAGSDFLHPERLMDAGGVRYGMHVADIGSGGSGHLVFPLAGRVGEEGKVYAVDVQQEVLQMIEGLRKLRGIHYVQTVWGDVETENGINIPEQSLDLAFLVNTLWTLKDQAFAVEQLRGLMKNDGRIVVLEWNPQTPHPLAPPKEFRLYDEPCDAYFSKGGFHPVEAFRLNPWQWGRIYVPSRAI